MARAAGPEVLELNLRATSCREAGPVPERRRGTSPQLDRSARVRLCTTSLIKIVAIMELKEKTTRKTAAAMILSVDATFIALLAMTLIVLVVTGLAATRYPTVPILDSDDLIPRGDDGWLVRYVHSRGVTILFGLTYLRLALALLAFDFGEGRRLAWLCWAGCLWAANFVALSGTMATLLHGDYWLSLVMIGLFTYWFPSLSDWLFQTVMWHPRPLQLILLHGMVAGAVVSFSCGVLLAARRRVVARLSTISWSARFALCAAILAGSMVVAWLMAWPAPFDNPDNLFLANPSQTPPHIMPEWYITPWFQMIRSMPTKGAGSIVLWIAPLLPLLVTLLPRPRQLPTRIILTLATSLLIIAFVILSTIGRSDFFWQLQLPSFTLTAFYFAYFIVFVPLLTLVDRALGRDDAA